MWLAALYDRSSKRSMDSNMGTSSCPTPSSRIAGSTMDRLVLAPPRNVSTGSRMAVRFRRGVQRSSMSSDREITQHLTVDFDIL